MRGSEGGRGRRKSSLAGHHLEFCKFHVSASMAESYVQVFLWMMSVLLQILVPNTPKIFTLHTHSALEVLFLPGALFPLKDNLVIICIIWHIILFLNFICMVYVSAHSRKGQRTTY